MQGQNREESPRIGICFEIGNLKLQLDFIPNFICLGRPRCCPPWHVVDDIVICREGSKGGYFLEVVCQVHGLFMGMMTIWSWMTAKWTLAYCKKQAVNKYETYQSTDST